MAKRTPHEQKVKSFVTRELRRASIRWPEKSEALKLSRKERGKYQCDSCRELFDRTAVHLDHRDPVIDIKRGWTDFNDFINRLFISADKYDVLCIPCHNSKTSLEDAMREHYKTKDIAYKPRKRKINEKKS